MAERLPSWIRIRVPTPAEAAGMREVRALLSKHGLTTVCQGAACPNAAECWSNRTATFMLLGEVCTRACRFCAVPTGTRDGVVDSSEPERIAVAVSALDLEYVVLTSVDRDDLDDGGAAPFADTIRAVRAARPGARIEVLIPDFSGSTESLDLVLAAGADVYGHNLETVESLSAALRDRRAGYRQSLDVLAYLAANGTGKIKSGLMLGLGETEAELLQTFRELREAGVEILTLGQYLRPGPGAAAVERFLQPEEFSALRERALELGFSAVVSGPLVRSSYHALDAFSSSCVS